MVKHRPINPIRILRDWIEWEKENSFISSLAVSHLCWCLASQGGIWEWQGALTPILIASGGSQSQEKGWMKWARLNRRGPQVHNPQPKTKMLRRPIHRGDGVTGKSQPQTVDRVLRDIRRERGYSTGLWYKVIVATLDASCRIGLVERELWPQVNSVAFLWSLSKVLPMLFLRQWESLIDIWWSYSGLQSITMPPSQWT